MIRIDEYTAQGANGTAEALRDTPAGLALVAAAVAASAHFPANGTRVIVGYIDTDGQPVLTDVPVMWFDSEGDPVILDADGTPEPVREYANPLEVYHPDAIPRIGSDDNPRDLAINEVIRRLANHRENPR